MATTTQTVIIDFQADFASVQDAVDILEKTGKVDADLAATFRKTNTEIQKQGQVLKTTSQAGTASTQSFTKLSQLMQQFPKTGMNRFLLQVGKELAAAGVSSELFFKKAKEGNELVVPKFDSLRLQLLEVRKRMEAAAQISGTLSKEYLALKEQAGALSNAIRDINSDIKNTGSDTRRIDDVVGSVSALAGGFSAVQGAAALFGDTSEDLQKALLKVNAAMAFATGLQQVSNALTKTGSLTRLADATATGFQIVAQRLYDATLKGSIVSLKAFKIALAATGIGLLVIGLVALISKLGGASRATKQLKKDLEDLRAGTDAAREAIQQEGEFAVALLEEQGVAQSKISKKRLNDLENERSAEEAGLLNLEATRTKLREQMKSSDIKQVTAAVKGLKLVEEQTITSEKNIATISSQLRIDAVKARTQESDEIKKENEKRLQDAKDAGEKGSAAAEKAREAAARQRALEFEDFKAGIELKLLATEAGSKEELDLQKKLLHAKLLIDLEGEEITANQRKLFIQQFFKEKLELEKKFNKAIIASAFEDEKNRLDASLQNLNLSEEDKLATRIDFLRIGAAQEIQSAEGNAAKIKLINAKLNADISAAKIESIRKAANDELALSSAEGGVAKRALDSVAANEKLKADIRINAIRQLGQIEITAIDRQIKANRDASKVIGADQKALTIEYEQLLDAKAAATEATEKKITDIIDKENEARKASDLAYIQLTLSSLQQVGDVIGEFQNNARERAEQNIDSQRKEVEALLEAGAITEREAKIRNKRLEAEERQAKTKAAIQQRNLALFQATITGAQAIMQAIASAPPPFNVPAIIITTALVTAQIAAIASRPIPKFAKGKKGRYEGPAEVAEQGYELIQREGGGMEVATKRQIVYLGAKDKVFTHSETKNILQPIVNKEAIRESGKVAGFDYSKLAKAIKQKPANGATINIDKEFISESVANGLNRVNYFNRYYSSK